MVGPGASPVPGWSYVRAFDAILHPAPPLCQTVGKTPETTRGARGRPSRSASVGLDQQEAMMWNGRSARVPPLSRVITLTALALLVSAVTPICPVPGGEVPGSEIVAK